MSSTIQVRVDDDLKNKSDLLFKDLGIDTTSAIRIFLIQAVANNGFPFEIKRPTENYSAYPMLSEEEIFEKLRIARQHSQEGRQRNANLFVADMRSKYGL